ncbi:MAG TPA: hypothetical protein VF793_19005, partial [Telluria sp.]
MRLTRHLQHAACAGLLSVLAAVPAAAALRTVGAVVQTVPTEDGLDMVLASGARVHVGFATPDVVRVRMRPGGSFGPDVSYAIAGAPPLARATLAQQGASIELRSASGTR